MQIWQNWPFQVILSHFGGKDVNQPKLTIPSHSEPLQWEKTGKFLNQAKLAILSHSEPLWWEKIGKDANQAKLAVLSHSEPLWWEKIGKVANQNVILTQSKIPFELEKLRFSFQCIL